MIYYVSDGDYVKVGYTDAGMAGVKTRLSQLQIGNARRLVLMGYHEGGIKEERALHLRLSALHVRGEWFAAVGPLAWCAWGSEVPVPRAVPMMSTDLDALEAEINAIYKGSR